MPTDAVPSARRAARLEATYHGKTRSGDLGTRVRRRDERECAVRAFRDIHGAEFEHHPTTLVLDGHDNRNPTGDDHLLRRHWIVVCSDRRSAAGRKGLR